MTPRVPSVAQDELEARVVALWRASGRRPSTIQEYLIWVHRYRASVEEHGSVPGWRLTLKATRAFVARYARRNGCVERPAFLAARSALHAWSCALQTLGYDVPDWIEPIAGPPVLRQLRSFLDYRAHQIGVSPATLHRDTVCITEFLRFLRTRGRRLERVHLTDVDAFVQHLGRRMVPKTLSGLCSTLRAFLRFLRVAGRLHSDLAPSVASPRVVTADRPPKTMEWQDVKRLLRAIDRGRTPGRRDFAMALMMASYGLGGAEVRSLDLDDIDWKQRILRVRRPKTGEATTLPLLPAVAQALAEYLKQERPAGAASRALFVSHGLPHNRLSSSSPIRHRLTEYARRAGLPQLHVGAHVLRHTHATRQIDSGAPSQVVSEILGHRDPSSTSVYVRVALRRLRSISLPVPR